MDEERVVSDNISQYPPTLPQGTVRLPIWLKWRCHREGIRYQADAKSTHLTHHLSPPNDACA